jgi:hypothetical protein
VAPPAEESRDDTCCVALSLTEETQLLAAPIALLIGAAKVLARRARDMRLCPLARLEGAVLVSSSSSYSELHSTCAHVGAGGGAHNHTHTARCPAVSVARPRRVPRLRATTRPIDP